MFHEWDGNEGGDEWLIIVQGIMVSLISCIAGILNVLRGFTWGHTNNCKNAFVTEDGGLKI